MSSLKEKLYALPEISKLQLLNILNTISGKKDIIFHENILKSLSQVVNIHDLRSSDVEKIYKLELANIKIRIQNFIGVIVTYNDLSLIKLLCQQILSEMRSRDENIVKYHFVIIPSVTTAIETLIEEEGLYGEVDLHSFLWQPILIDSNVVSLEIPKLYSSLFLKKNLLLIPSITRSLQHFFALFGQPKCCFINGEISNDIYSSLDKSCFQQNMSCDVDYFLMMDRSIDYASSLLWPTTYAGFLEETFGLDKDVIELGNGVVINKKTDLLYTQLKNKKFIEVTNFLKEKSKSIQQEQTKFKNIVSMPEIKQYISENLKSILELKKKVSSHIDACEKILISVGEFYGDVMELENNIANESDRSDCLEHINNLLCSQKLRKESILQLLCLFSYYNQGVPFENYHEIKTNFLNIYGYEHLITFHNLEKTKLLIQKSKKPVLTLKANFELKTIINNIKSPNDISVNNVSTNGYYVTRIIELIVTDKFTVEKLCEMSPNSCRYYINDNPCTNSKDKLNFVVYVVGGITSNEVACLNLLEQKLDVNIIVNTSNRINGDCLMRECMAV